MTKSRSTTLLIVSFLALTESQAIAGGLCTPAMTIKEVRFSQHASHRTWTAIVGVDRRLAPPPLAASSSVWFGKRKPHRT
jgi:hypothetical protein